MSLILWSRAKHLNNTRQIDKKLKIQDQGRQVSCDSLIWICDFFPHITEEESYVICYNLMNQRFGSALAIWFHLYCFTVSLIQIILYWSCTLTIFWTGKVKVSNAIFMLSKVILQWAKLNLWQACPDPCAVWHPWDRPWNLLIHSPKRMSSFNAEYSAVSHNLIGGWCMIWWGPQTNLLV